MQVSEDLKELYNKMLELKMLVNAKLSDGSFEAIRDLIKMLDESEVYPRLLEKDTQLSMLDIFLGIWLDEKRELSALGIASDIMTDVSDLDVLEDKYHTISLSILRFENDMLEEYLNEAIDRIIAQDISGIALYKILKIDTIDHVNNVIKVSTALRARKEYIRDMFFVRLAVSEYPNDPNVVAQLGLLLSEFEGK